MSGMNEKFLFMLFIVNKEKKYERKIKTSHFHELSNFFTCFTCMPLLEKSIFHHITKATKKIFAVKIIVN